ncbi:hypothetical protein A5819_003498 [Enterococcus sp. 7E2_DIV0204]|uniref:hypothetical protein n=1 Tax=unclassified Enterococcus TaxID=2608891 RepID=UPI000A348F89|nr:MULTISPECIES: hypothetical protein [unclassified Enterococcus]OTN83948.1 hypothetical protein A5819_003498 [Enterococcus sp. 7E2_DIV0204]OTP46856.1 hypothetical protein A5884_003734 [Enterococcus sp. 7D2_DIV0200]
MLKEKSIVVIVENEKEVLYKVDCIPYTYLADCTAYHAELGFFQGCLNPHENYPLATGEQESEFENAFSDLLSEIENPITKFRFLDYRVKKILGVDYTFTAISRTKQGLKVKAITRDTNPLVSVEKFEEIVLQIHVDEEKKEEFVHIFGIKVYASQFSYGS